MPLVRHMPCRSGCAGLAGLLLGCAAQAATPAANEGGAAEAWSYTVVPGDTLIGVAARHLDPRIGWQSLQRRNKVANPRRLAPGSRLDIPVAWLRREAGVAEAIHVQGDVRAGSAADAGPALAAGARLRSGDVVRTGAQSTLTLRLSDGSRVLVPQLSRITIEQLLVVGSTGRTDTSLRVDEGGVDSQVVPAGSARFKVRTPTLHLGVRGTEFRVRVDAQSRRSQAEVLQGRVAADNDRSAVQLDAGFGAAEAAPGVPLAAQRLMAAPDLGGMTARAERIPLRLAWPAVDAAAGYRAQVFADRSFERLLLDGIFREPLARWNDLADGSYVLRVRSLASDGLEGLDADAPFVLKARPEPPFTRQPGDAARVYGDKATFEWTRATQVTRYRLQVSAGDDFAEPRVDQGGLAETSAQMPLPPGRYQWRVASVLADGDQGPFGDAQAFEMRKIPASPPLEAPMPEGDSLRVRWKAGEPGGSYQVQFARDAQFTQGLVEQLVAEPQVALPLPAPGTYYLRVKSIDADGYAGPFGPAQEVQIPYSKWWLLIPVGLWLLLL